MMPYPVGSLTDLFSTGFIEILLSFLHSFIILLCMTITKKAPKQLQFLIGIAIVLVQAFYIWNITSKSQLLLVIVTAALFSIEFKQLRLCDVSTENALFLFAAFLLPYRLLNSSLTTMGYGSWYLLILFTLLTFEFLNAGTLRGRILSVYISFIYLSFSALIFFPIMEYIMYHFQTGKSLDRAAMVLFLTLALLFAFVTVYLVSKKYNRIIITARRISRKFIVVDKIISFFAAITTISIVVIPLPFLLTRTVSNLLLIYINIFHLFLLIFQVAFVYMLYFIEDYRITLDYMKQSQKSTVEYYQNLNKNLQDMENLRHDTKNLFMTMGGFVEKSSDSAMKIFYQEKIYPFALDQIEKNYQFSQLYQIPSETLRSFLHMKLFQAFNLNVNISLNIQIDEDLFFLGMDIIDLTRILGIFMDNAIDECENLPDSHININIRNQENLVSYSIKNSVRAGHQFEHMILRKSDKIGHSGKGLQIVKEIVDSYPQVMLNTYYDKADFRQSLNISN